MSLLRKRGMCLGSTLFTGTIKEWLSQSKFHQGFKVSRSYHFAKKRFFCHSSLPHAGKSASLCPSGYQYLVFQLMARLNFTHLNAFPFFITQVLNTLCQKQLLFHFHLVRGGPFLVETISLFNVTHCTFLKISQINMEIWLTSGSEWRM